jgi:hypothetical protein
MCTDCYRVTDPFEFTPATFLCLTQILPGRLIFYDRVLKSVACAALVFEVADEITIFFSEPGNKINELVVISKILTSKFAGLVRSCLGPVVTRCCT